MLPSLFRRKVRPAWICYVVPAFLGFPKQGDKSRTGYLTPAFSGAQKWAELLWDACVLGGPETRGQKQKWLLRFFSCCMSACTIVKKIGKTSFLFCFFFTRATLNPEIVAL